MSISPRTFIFIALFNLAIGIGLVAEHLFKDLTIWIYEPLVQYAYRDQYVAIEQSGLNNRNEIAYTPYHYTEPKPVSILSLDRESASEAFRTIPLAPLDWAVIMNYLKALGADNIYIQAPFAWEERQNELVLSVLNKESARFHSITLGKNIILSARGSDIPEEWKSIAITKDRMGGDISKLPLANKLYGEDTMELNHAPSVPALIEHDALAFSNDNDASSWSIPLFARWNQYVLPTAPLIAAARSLGIDPDDIHADFGNRLSLGDKLYMPLDNQGRIPLRPNSSSSILKPSEIIILPNNIAMSARKDEIEQTVRSSPITLIWEPSNPTEQTGEYAQLTAKTMSSILAGIIPGQTTAIDKLSPALTWILLIDLVLIGLWSLRFTNKYRWIILSSCLVLTIAAVLYFLLAKEIWIPVISLLFSLLSIAVAAIFIKPTHYSDEHQPDEQDGDSSLPDIESYHYQEPDEIPIPVEKTSTKNSTP